MKYIITDKYIVVDGIKLYQIQALESFGNIQKGDLGGYIEKKENLSQEGNSWVYGDARVSGGARVSGNARVFGDAQVYGNARVSGNARVFGDAQVYGDARVSGDAWVYGNAWVSGDAWVYENAQVYGNARVSGNARVYGKVWLKYGKFVSDSKDIIKIIASSLNCYPINKKYIFYKRVNKLNEQGIYKSCYNSSFTYKIGEIAVVNNVDKRWEMSCSTGIHVSHPTYWDNGNTLIAVEVELCDIITCQEGKVRCRKVKVLEEIGDNV